MKRRIEQQAAGKRSLREILTAALVLGGLTAATLYGVQSPDRSATSTPSPCRPCATSTPHPELGGEELFVSGVIYNQGIVRYDAAKRPEMGVKETAWFNVASSDLRINSAGMGNLLGFFDRFAETEPLLEYKIGTETVPLVVSPRPAQYRVLLINNPSTTSASQWAKTMKDIPEKSVIGKRYQYFTNITVQSWYDQNDLSWQAAYAACDASLIARREGWTESDPLWQRIVCESFAQTYKYRLEKIPYQNEILGVDAFGYT